MTRFTYEIPGRFQDDVVRLDGDPLFFTDVVDATETAIMLPRNPQYPKVILYESDYDTDEPISMSVFLHGALHNSVSLQTEMKKTPTKLAVAGLAFVELLLLLVIISFFILTVFYMVKKAFWVAIYLCVGLAIVVLILSFFKKRK